MKKGKLLWYNRLKGFHRGFPMNIVSKVAKRYAICFNLCFRHYRWSNRFYTAVKKTDWKKVKAKPTLYGFIQTLVFGWLSNPNATIEELTQTAATLGITITPQGLDKRFTEKAANFIKQVLLNSTMLNWKSNQAVA